ncbi:uncharacterized protein TRUGW13939_04555, partial [Talaromyces rugulosus]
MVDSSDLLYALRLCCLALLLSGWAYLYIQKRYQIQADKAFSQEHGCEPIRKRLPYKWPLAIDILKYQYDALMQGNLLAYQADYFQRVQVGHTFEVKLLGRIGYFTSNPKNLEAMLQTNFDDWELGSSRNPLLPMIGRGIFTQDGHHAWKHSRETMRRQFARMQYQDLRLFEGPINDMLAYLQSFTGVIDLQPAFFRFTLATTTSLIFGEPFVDSKKIDDETFAENFDYTSLVSAMRMRLADWGWVYNPSRYRTACALVNDYATMYVNHALQDVKENGEEVATKRHPFILDLFKELQDAKLVRDQLMNAVNRPPSNASARRYSLLLKTGGMVTRAQISKMTYLRCVLNETNRLYTQIPMNIRTAKRTTCLPKGGGPDGKSPMLVAKGVGVAFSAYYMHRSKEVYGVDVDEFCPERWEGPELKNIGFAFMPFHGGPRRCLGSKIPNLLQCNRLVSKR